MRTVSVRIDTKGNAKVNLDGFHGQGCAKVTEALGKIGRTVKEENKPEFYEQVNNSQTLTIG